MFRQIRQLYSDYSSTRVLGVFAVIWFSLIVQPCAFAAVSESDCANCSPEIEVGGVIAPSHCEQTSESSRDGTPSHDSMYIECCDIDDSIVNVRLETPKAEDVPAALPPCASFLCTNCGALKKCEITIGPPCHHGAPVPLHVLNCVYLN